ncbi:hypothetical protein Tco_0968036 [Tanacetum coccineum]
MAPFEDEEKKNVPPLGHIKSDQLPVKLSSSRARKGWSYFSGKENHYLSKGDVMGVRRCWFKGSSTNACNRTICTMAITFLRYIDTRPKGDALRKCILEGPYQPTSVTIPAVPTIENSPEVPE